MIAMRETKPQSAYCNCPECVEERGGWACATCGSEHLTRKEASVHSWSHLVYVDRVKMCEEPRRKWDR